MKKVRRLYEQFQPEQYALYIDPDRTSREITGTVTVTGAKKGRPSQRLTFHQHGLTVTKAAIIKHDKRGDQEIVVARINHQKTLDEVRLHTESMLYPGSYTVTMEYAGKITDSTHGIYPCNYEIDGEHKALIATDLESHHAREVLPCIDEPEAKATFDLTLVSPAGEVALSNTPAKTQEEKDGKLITVFEQTPKMSTYLLCFVYGDMQYKEATTKDGVTVKVWATKNHTPAALDFGLDTAKKGIEFFNDYYGVPYPLSKCDLVALPDFSAAAMENWGIITFREPFLLTEPDTASQSSREYVALVIDHELSHQWFGNLVTMKWWDNLWLNESFANVMEYVATHGLYPEWNVWNMFVTNEGLAAQRRDAIAGVQAVKSTVNHPDEINALFDPSIVYAKGGRLINMLVHYIGEEDFRKGLTAYFKKHAYGNTTGDDLWAALSSASGKDIAAFMNPWLERPNFPVIHVDQDGTALKISQEHFLMDPAKADPERIWPVPLLATAPEIPALLDSKSINVVLPQPDHIRVNKDAVGHYIVHYARPEHMAAIASLVDTKALNESERLMLLSDSSMLSRAGMQSFARTLELLNHYRKEDTEPVWDIMALIVADCRRFISSNPELEPCIKALVRDLIEAQYQRLGWEEKASESSQDVKLRATILGLGVYSEHVTITERALELFASYKSDPSVVSSELRSIVFSTAIRSATPGAFDYLLDLEEKTSNVDLKQEIMGTLTATRSADDGKRLLARLKDTKKVRPHDVDHWLVYLLRNRYTQENAWNWLRDNWDWIEKTFSTDKSFDYFPRYAASALNTRVRMEEYKAFFVPLQHWAQLSRNIDMGIEELENRIAWLERDISAVTEFLTKRQQ
jgi:aminopeptidase N